MAKVNIDGQEYDTEQLSQEARNQVNSIKFVDHRIAELKGEVAALQTARNAYTQALNELLGEQSSQG